MHGSSRFAVQFCGVALLAAAGCTWYPYSPYSNGYYGPAYGTPNYGGPGYMTPSPTYVPQNSAPMLNSPSSPTLINPGTTTNPPGKLNLYPDNTGGDAPPYRPTPLDNPVPQPRDNPFGGGAPPGAAMIQPPGAFITARVQPAGLKTDDPFVTPARLTADASAQPMPTTSPDVSPYAFDAEGYGWLKGIVDYDGETKTWAVIYSLTPEPNDRFGGSFTLAPSEQLGTLHHGDLVSIVGQPHPRLKDGRGFPLYQIAKLSILGSPAGK